MIYITDTLFASSLGLLCANAFLRAFLTAAGAYLLNGNSKWKYSCLPSGPVPTRGRFPYGRWISTATQVISLSSRSLRRRKLARERGRMNGPDEMRGRRRGSGHRKCAMTGRGHGRVRKSRRALRYG